MNSPTDESNVISRDLTPEQVSRLKIGIKALRLNTGKEARGKMRREDGRRCCLCVLMDSAIEQGYKTPRPINFYEVLPPQNLHEFFGMQKPMGAEGVSNCGMDAKVDGHAVRLNSLNDSRMMSHSEIADIIESNYPQTLE